jgi:hypothetical protein
VLSVLKFVANKSVTKMDHPPFSPDLTPPPLDFWLSPKLNISLRGQRFANIPDIQHNMTMLLQGILENYFRDFPAVVPLSHEVHGISKVAAAASAQVSTFCFHRDIPEMILSHLI